MHGPRDTFSRPPGWSYIGLYRDSRKENGNYCSIIRYILGLYRGYIGDNGKQHGNYENRRHIGNVYFPLKLLV